MARVGSVTAVALAGDAGIYGSNAISIDAMREQVEATCQLDGQVLASLPGADLLLGGTNEPAGR